MQKELKIPNLGENIDSAEVLKVLVNVGDKIEKEQSILEISSDKATLEIPADFAGIIKEVKVKEGDSVKEGQSIFIIDDQAQSSENEKSQPDSSVDKETQEAKPIENSSQGQHDSKEQAIENVSAPDQNKQSNKAQSTDNGKTQFLLPNLGENIAQAEVLRVLVKVGDKIEKEQSILEISSDKATLEVPSDISGVVREVKVKEGDSIKEGDLVLEVEGNTSNNQSQNQPAPAQTAEKSGEIAKDNQLNTQEVKKEVQEKQVENAELRTEAIVQNNHKRSKDVAPAAPSVRRFAREIGIDINQVKGSGENGRISVEDIKTFSKSLNQNRGNLNQPQISSGQSGYTENLPDFSKWGEVSKESMNNVRLKTAQHLGYAWNSIPHVTHFEKVDITDLEKLRKNYAKKVEVIGGKLTMTSILIKIVSSALKVFPKFAASIDMNNKEIIYKKYIHLGLAVDTDRGLLVPVIKDTDKKNISQISVEVGQVAQKAKDKKLSMDDMQGAVFTISNLGGIGGIGFTPVVNSPEVAILGVSQSKMEPVYIDENFVPRLMMPLSLSYDHRLIDGADAARFMKWLKEAIENPFLIMLEG